MVGTHTLHKNVAIICAGNLETDGAIVNEMSTALQSRLIHFELIVDAEEWCEWAEDNKIDHRIIDFIRFKPSNLYTFKPDHTDRTYSCPRTLEFTSRITVGNNIDSKDLLPILTGTLSEGVARELIVFMKIYDSLPSMIEIQASPETVKVPDEPSILYALTGAISHNTNSTTATNIMKYVVRLPIEFQVITMNLLLKCDKTLLTHPAIQNWLNKSSIELF